MRSLKHALSVLLLVVGCSAVLWLGFTTEPTLGESIPASEDGDWVIESLFGTGDDSDAVSPGLASRSDGADPEITTADTPSDEKDGAYETVFPDDRILRIDLVIAAEDWQAMLDEVSGSTAGDGKPDRGDNVDAMVLNAPAGTMDQVFTEACNGCGEGDPISLSMPFGDVSGTCIRVGEDLVFQPDENFDGEPWGDIMPARGIRPEGAPGPGDGAFMQPGMDEPGRGPERMMVGQTADAGLTYVECTVLYEDQMWEHVGVRFKGNSTLRSTVGSGSWKYPLHLDFDEFEEEYPETRNQRFFGFDDLALSNGATDTSLLRDLLPGEIFRSFGVPTPEMTYVQIYLDTGEGPTWLGVYTMVETPDDPFLEAQFGSSDGNLYKPQGAGATWTTFDETSFAKKSNQDEGDWADIEAAFEALHASREDTVSWREGLEAVFDVDGFLRWLAINRLLGNWDAYGQMAQNYYLYSDPTDGLIHWIPWDLNQSLNSRMQRGAAAIDPRTVGDQWPLIGYLLDDPVYFDVYTGYVADALATVYDAASLGERVSELQEMLIPYLTDDDGDLSEHSFLASVAQFERSGEEIVAEIEARIAEAEAFLEEQSYEPSAIVITEIHYNPSPDQGDDSAYEFIELANRSGATVDLSGYRFDDGVAYTFPDGIDLGPGETLILAKDAEQYSMAPCLVLQWESGSLSNGGETLRLVDADGFWVDCVSYGDDVPWPDGCDGDGSSLGLLELDAVNHLAVSWGASSEFGGSPGVIPNDG